MKKRLPKIYLSFLSLILAFFIYPFVGQAQSVWFDEDKHTSKVGIELMIPSYDGIEPDGAAFASYIYSNLPVSDKLALKFDLPVSHFNDGGGEANFAVGNPYIGVQRSRKNGDFKIDFGIRLPLASETSGALTTGLATEQYIAGAFVPNVYTVVSNFHYRYSSNSNFIIKLGGGPEAIFPEDGGGELFLKYYGQLLYGINNVTFGGGLSGQFIATVEGPSFSERTIHNIAISGSYDFGQIDIGAYVERTLASVQIPKQKVKPRL